MVKKVVRDTFSRRPIQPRESAWATENLANEIASLNEFADGIQWQERARDHWLEWYDQQSVLRGAYPACLKKSIAMILAGLAS